MLAAMTKPTVKGVCLFIAVLVVAGCATATPRTPERIDRTDAAACRIVDEGKASYYGDKFHGRRTASGERFSQQDLTAAHRTLPFGTELLVENKNNGKAVLVRVNDRGPFIKGRVIDLSKAAAQEISMIGSGVVPVSVKRCH